MLEFKAMPRKWGNSIGITLPNEIVEEGKIKENKEIQVLILKQTNVLKKTFGTLKIKKSAQEAKDEIRKELYGI